LKTCFIILPFSQTTTEHTESYWKSHFEEFLKPVIEEIGDIEVTRSDTMRGDILNQIIFKLINSDIVIADVTDSNPNVYWELGVRHSYKNGTIIISDKNYKIPFDISKSEVHFYHPNDHIKNEHFIRKIKKAVKNCCTNPEIYDSHVLEAVSGRGSIYNLIYKEDIIRKIEGIIEEDKENIRIMKEENISLRNDHQFPILGSNLGTIAMENLLINRYIDNKYIDYNSNQRYITATIRRMYAIQKLANQKLTENEVNKYIKNNLEIISANEEMIKNYLSIIETYRKMM
jgi:hypothetical protein